MNQPLDTESPDLPFLWDMREAALGVLRFTRGRSAMELDDDLALRQPVERGIVIIGRSARLVTPHTQALCPDVAWRQFAGAAALLSDADDGLDAEELWDLVARLPDLVRALSRIMPFEEDADL